MGQSQTFYRFDWSKRLTALQGGVHDFLEPPSVPLCGRLAKSVKVSSLRASFVPTLPIAPGSSRFFLLSASLPLAPTHLQLPESVFGPSHPSTLPIPSLPFTPGPKLAVRPLPSPAEDPSDTPCCHLSWLTTGVEKRHPPAGECPATNLLLILIQLLLAFGVGFGAIPN
jgi:hypothetical protein